MIVSPHSGVSLKGRLRCQVVDSRTGKVKRDLGWQPNMILNRGMDALATIAMADSFICAAIGTGVTPTFDDSGDTVATQVGTEVTVAGGFLTFTDTSTDAGKSIKWDTGEVSMILTVVDATHVTVMTKDSKNVATGQFTVYRTAQTVLAAETERSVAYLIGAGNCETVFDFSTQLADKVGLVYLRRTFDFVERASAITYWEVGLSSSQTAQAGLFSRIKLISGLSVNVGEQARVIYELRLAVSPIAPREVSSVISGWTNTGGSEALENLGIRIVDSGGYSVSQNAYYLAIAGFMESYYQGLSSGTLGITLSDSDVALPSLTAVGGRSAVGRNGTNYFRKNLTVDAYSPLSFRTTRRCTIAAGEANFTIRTIFVWYLNESYVPGLIFKFTEPKTKTTGQVLSLNWNHSWSREL